MGTMQAISAAEAERLASLATMRAEECIVNLLRLQEFKQFVRRQHVQVIKSRTSGRVLLFVLPAPSLPFTNGNGERDGFVEIQLENYIYS
jgi:hypothetical protein